MIASRGVMALAVLAVSAALMVPPVEAKCTKDCNTYLKEELFQPCKENCLEITEKKVRKKCIKFFCKLTLKSWKKRCRAATDPVPGTGTTVSGCGSPSGAFLES